MEEGEGGWIVYNSNDVHTKMNDYLRSDLFVVIW